MQKYNGQLIRQFASSVSGNAASGVTVMVRRQSDSALATLYAENSTSGATLVNPITTSSTGHFSFYAEDGVYTLTFSDTTPQQVIQLQDVSELQAQFDAAVLNAGYIPSGTFSAGATLTQANQVLSDGSSYWRWDGSFPKVVTAGSAPTPTGVGGWIVLSDFALRGDLADTGSSVLVGGVEAGRVASNSRRVNILDYVTNKANALSGTENIRPAIEAAVRFLMTGDQVGGTVYFPKPSNFYNLGGSGHDFWQYMLEQQGITDGTFFFANGKPVRGTQLWLEFEQGSLCRTLKGASWSGSYLFKWGRFLITTTNVGMSGGIIGNPVIEGPGTIGTAGKTWIAGPNGYTSSANPNIGTSDTTTSMIDASIVIPPFVVDASCRYFNIAAENEWGFGFYWRTGSIQYCNVGTNPKNGTTNFRHGKSLEIEVCDIGTFIEFADQIGYDGTIIEANAVDFLMQKARFVRAEQIWTEGAPAKNILLRGVNGEPSFANENITFDTCLGVNFDSKGPVKNFLARNCPLNDKGERWEATTGEAFQNVVYDNCTISSAPFNLAALTVAGTITKNDITIIGDAVGKEPANFGAREPSIKRGSVTATASAPPQTAFKLRVPNQYTTAVLMITGFRIAQTGGQDAKIAQFVYVGTVGRFGNQNTVVDFDASQCKTYSSASFGLNAPVTIAAPDVLITSGGINDTQESAIRFVAGTAASSAAETMYEARLLQANDGVEFL